MVQYLQKPRKEDVSMTLPDILKFVSILLVLVTTLCYAYQTVYLFVPLFQKKQPLGDVKRHRYAILIAARNEEAVLPHLLESIQAQDYPAELLTTYVVADNCTDRTAEIAAAHGAKVFTRFNQEKVGKGYALNHLLEQIRHHGGLDRYDAFLIFDADNLLSPDYISQINKVCAQGYDAFCGYRNSKNFGTNWVSAGHAIWYLHDSVHLNQSRMLLGNPCAVTGTGFGFTRALLDKCGGWNFFTLTEDIEFSVWCATRGIRVGYCHDAVLYDEQPDRFRQSWRQRTRWVQGAIQVSIRYAGDMLRGMARGGRTGYASLEAATLSLWGYGMGALCVVTMLLTIVLTAGWLGVGQALILVVMGTFCSMFLVSGMTLLTEWDRIRATTGEKIMAFFAFPLYMLSYIPICVTALFRKFHWPPIEHTVAISAKQLQDIT